MKPQSKNYKKTDSQERSIKDIGTLSTPKKINSLKGRINSSLNLHKKDYYSENVYSHKSKEMMNIHGSMGSLPIIEEKLPPLK
mmetsp:Transcript_9364/g.8272  ORF Transcript_9364/g.8272 Transcript_9364/m.8272 type:complete len:83 (-) Transcript_9364:195-443(-)